MAPELKRRIQDFWNRESCGEVYASGASWREYLEAQATARYTLEPYIPGFARFEDGAGREVLEIGVGMGADHLRWAQAGPRRLAGVDLTNRAVEFTRARLQLWEQSANLAVADAERLPFADESFDVIYSWGVMHHTPDTPRAIQEVLRLLRPGGVARIMLYHRSSVIGGVLWLRYGLLAGRPGRRLEDLYAHHLESPGTQAFSEAKARSFFSGFSRVQVRRQISVGDLLEGVAGQRHQGPLLSVMRRLWPRWFIRRALARYGLFLLIEAVK